MGLQLLDQYDALIGHVLEYPRSGTTVDLRGAYQVRCFRMRRFRYSVFTTIIDEQLVVFSISHHKREPGYWTERLKKLGR